MSIFSKIVSGIVVAGATSLASADAVTLTAAGGPLVDRVGTTNGIAVFDYVDDDSASIVQSIESVTLTGLTHTWSSDLQAILVWFPDDPLASLIQVDLFDGLNDGVNFSSNPLNGTYSFTDEATATLQSVVPAAGVVPGGTYAPASFYIEGTAPAINDLDAAFAGVDLSAGTFGVAFIDFVGSDTGALVSATLNLTTVVPEPTSLAALGLAGALVRRRRA
jgi:PEP-CTERM motif